MDRRQFMAASTAGAAAAFAGCVGSALEDEDPEDSSADPGSTGADPDGNADAAVDEYGEIEVSAEGSVEAEPDRAVLRIGVEAQSESADEVRSQLADGAEALRETFDELGIPDERIQTAAYHIGDRHREEGFAGAHAFSVEVDEIDRVGEIIDASVEAGANDVGRVNFTLREETREQLREDAIDAALANADEEAEHVADNREVEIVATESVSTDDVSFGSVRREVALTAGDDAGASTSIDSGPVTVSATVRVVYRFER